MYLGVVLYSVLGGRVVQCAWGSCCTVCMRVVLYSVLEGRVVQCAWGSCCTVYLGVGL